MEHETCAGMMSLTTYTQTLETLLIKDMHWHIHVYTQSKITADNTDHIDSICMQTLNC